MPQGPEAVAGVSEGQVLAGKYRVERVLGAGGMGVVVAARHIDLDERVAIKFLLPEMLVDGTAVARFQREAKAAVRIKSEYVARVLDVGRLDNGAPYMVMEYLEGSDLAGWLEKHGALPGEQAVDFVVQACVAVADAHVLGIVHRDLKPANLFCVRRSDGQLSIKVLDFGISKLVDAPGSGMSFTQTSAMMGSPLYMSPEQFRSSKSVDQRTDIWALGAILFELVTGRAPFTAESVPELAIKIATEPPLSASALRPDLPPGLVGVIAKCLEKDPARRYADVAELAVALAPFATPPMRVLVDRVHGIVGKRDSVVAVSAPSPVVSTLVDGPTAPAIHFTSPGLPQRRGFAVPLGVLGVVALLGAGAFAWWRSTSSALAPVLESSAPAAVATPPVAIAEEHAPLAPTAVPPPADSERPAVVPAPSATLAVAPPKPERPSGGTSRSRPSRAPKSTRSAASPATAVVAPAVPAAAQPTPPPSPRVSCDPPFYFDSKGNRVFKQECL